MEQREFLEKEIEQTTRELKYKLGELEQQTRHKVDEITEGVTKTVQGISEGVEKLSLKHQIETRPATVIAASVGAGVLVGRRMGRRPARTVGAAPVRSPGVFARMGGAVMPLVWGVGVNAVATWARRKYPKSADAINLIETAVITRL
ncbi:hypothetical protein K2X33_05215 [bacterium]|nr:hypothetical protein [bacterium]